MALLTVEHASPDLTDLVWHTFDEKPSATVRQSATRLQRVLSQRRGLFRPALRIKPEWVGEDLGMPHECQSEDDPTAVYTVWVTLHQGRTACTCPAGLHGRLCKHQVLARLEYTFQHDSRREP